MHIYDKRHIIKGKYSNMELITMEEILTPSYHGELCRHNGNKIPPVR